LKRVTGRIPFLFPLVQVEKMQWLIIVFEFKRVTGRSPPLSLGINRKEVKKLRVSED